jgi:hypothetical protein
VEKEMRHVIIAFVSVFIGISASQLIIHANAKERMDSKENPEKLVCVSNAELDKTMKEKGYGVLLNMTNDNGVVETVWVSGQSITITAAVEKQDTSCLLAVMKDVTYNPNAIEQIYEIYKKQTKQKDI